MHRLSKNESNENYDHLEYSSEQRSQSCFGKLTQQWVWLKKLFVILIEKVFEKSTMFISRRPFHVALFCLILAIVLISGFMKIKVEENVKYLFLPEDSKASQDIHKARNFHFELQFRQEEVIILPKRNKTVLSQECLEEMIDLHKIITQVKFYERYCFRPHPNERCISMNLLDVFDYQKKNLVNISRRIKMVFHDDTFLMSNGRRLKDNFDKIFGNRASSNSPDSTNALRIVYFMNEYTTRKHKEDILEWEKIFIDEVSSFSKTTSCSDIFYSAERSLDDSVSKTTISDIKFFALTFTIIGIFSGVVTSRCADAQFRHQLLGFGALVSICLGVTAAHGFLMFLGFPFVSTVGILPFLVVSIVIDDVFIIFNNLNEMIRQNIPAMYMLSGTMGKSSPPFTMATLPYLVVFAVNSRSIFPVIRYFCTYAAFTISSAFIMLVTLFVCLMWFDIKRVIAKRRNFLYCLFSPTPTNCCSGIEARGFDNVMRVWGKIITSVPGKITVCIFSLLLLSGGIYGALNVDKSFNRQSLTTKEFHYREFLNAYEANFHQNIEVNIIFPGEQEHSSRDIQNMYSHVKKLAKSNKHFISKSISWLSQYLRWAEKRRININNTRSFYQNLQTFVSFPKYKRFVQDVRFSKDKTHFTASRILLYSKNNPDSIFQRDMMISIREDLLHSSDVDAFAIALSFRFFEQYAHVFNETIRNLIVAGILSLLITSLFLNHFIIVICLLCGFVALILELLGLMYVWDISVNSLSMINLVMALGFSVDYNAQVSYHFLSSKATSPELRIIDALSKIGGGVFLGGISIVLGMIPLGFASSRVFQIFLKLFLGIEVLCLLHALIILPVYLTLLAKIFDFREMNIDSIIYKKSRRTSNRKASKITNTNPSKNVVKVSSSFPVAIIGISCRFPGGANSKDAFWDMLVEGRSGIGLYPTNRPDAREFLDSFNTGKNTPGKHYVLTGAFLENITGFDAQFFGISPTECRSMDPQQRILLQVVYEAIEDAGLRLEDLQQCRTGVYVGLMNADFSALLLDPSNIRNIDQFSSTGCATSVVANRISFSLNLTGPSFVVDTACSSSLIAFNLAFAHLQTGECDVAIVCAPNILLTGTKFHMACCRTGLLAQDGRCKCFNINGDGYGRGEGVAAVVIKPTKAALEDRDDIYAEVVACGMNNDGQTAIPITAPSETTQTALFQRVLQESGLSKNDIQYVEAHGTGTAVGDVVEMGSLSAVYGNSRKRILRVGSVKSNINHTESTSGLAGLIKTCLMIKHAQFVPTINVHEEKPQLRMTERKMMVQACNEPWKTEAGKPRTAAISSYGFGGTNAHVIVREVTKKPVTVIPCLSVSHRVMTMSASSNDALRALAKKVCQWLETLPDDDELLKDNICYSLNERYTVHSHRLAVSFSTFKTAARALEKFASQEKGWEEVVAVGDVITTRNKVVFLYGGQGAQWYGMAREMIVYEPKFKESIDKIDSLLKRYKAPWSLITELQKPEETSRLQENPIGQTALFAVHFAITELLKSWGVTPSAVVGHSLGEISAAWASGALSLHKALKLVLLRSQLHEKCSPTGCMAAVGLSEDDARIILDDLHVQNKIDIAVINSPENVVLSGDKEYMELVENHVISTRSNIFWRNLITTRAYHSQEMEEIKHAYFKLTSEFNVRQSHTNIPFYSTVTATQLSGQLLSREHWWKNIRQAVLLESVLKIMFSDGYKFFIEINASPQLSHHVRQTWSKYGTSNSLDANEAVVIQTLPKRSATQQHLSLLQNCVAHLFAHGIPLSWGKVQGFGSKLFIPRPTYPWQEKTFWYRDNPPSEFVTYLDEQKAKEENETTSKFHLLLGKIAPTGTFSGLHAWESEINLDKVSYINDHKFEESPNPVIPAAVYVEMILAMSLDLCSNAPPDVRAITFKNLLTISNDDSYRIRTRLLPEKRAGEEKPFQITIVKDNEYEVVLSEGSIYLGDNDGYDIKVAFQQRNPNDIEILKSAMPKLPKGTIQLKREKMGLTFGPQFDLITEAWSNGAEALALICLTEEIIDKTSAYVMHPSIIDASFQTLLLLFNVEGKFVPQKISRVTIVQKPTYLKQFYAYTNVVGSGKRPTCDITVMDKNARTLMIIEKLLTAEISANMTEETFETSSFTFGWQQMTSELPAVKKGRIWLILRDKNEFAKRFSHHITSTDRVKFVDRQNTTEETREVFSTSLDEVLSKRKSDEMLLVINFWPVDGSNYEVDVQNFDATHATAFESCLLISQETLTRQSFAKNIQLVFVTAGVVSIPQSKNHPRRDTSRAFPWSASVFGFRRTFSEEITCPNASVVDLPENPNDNDFHAMLQDVCQATMEEEIAYRNGMRYVNRMKKFDTGVINFTRQESPLGEDGVRKPFKITRMSGQWFLQKTSKERMTESLEIEVFCASPILHKPWEALKLDDRISISGRLCNREEVRHQKDCVVVGVCNVSDLGSYVSADRCCYSEINNNLTPQHAASLCFSMAMSYHILKNILTNVQGKKVLIHHQSEMVCCVFACVATSLNMNAVCLVKDQSNKARLKAFGDLVILTEEEIMRTELNSASCMNFDSVCFLSKSSVCVTRRVMKHLKPGARIITVHGKVNRKFNPLVNDKDVHCILTNLEIILENSEVFSKLLATSCSVLKSRGLLERLLDIPHIESSIYDVTLFTKSSNDKSSHLEENPEMFLHTISFKPKTSPEGAVFYKLPLDSNGFKDDRTYLVIGGVRGFGFEVARWLIENGAKTVMCTARSAPSDAKKSEVQCLEQENGSRILLRQADVTSWKDMNVIKEELNRLPAVAGIVFSAMILKDQSLKEADLKTCKEVVATKLTGSVILHQLSLSMDLDFFVMFSSISGVLGNEGQVAYAAANTFLDHLCEYRRHKLGLPALSVNWGPINGAGVLERIADISSVLRRHGFIALHYKTALEFLKRVLLENSDEAQVCLSPMNWQVYLRSHSSPRLTMIRDETVVETEKNLMTMEDLALQPLEFRINYVQEFIKRLLSSWSEVDVNEIDLNLGLQKYGIDSIAATNMKFQIKNNIGATFETYYFIQPKTNGLMIINDILEKINNTSTMFDKDDSLRKDNQGCLLKPTEETMSDKNNSLGKYKKGHFPEPTEKLFEAEIDAESGNGIELKPARKPENKEKVIPLCTSDDAVVKVFMVHGSQKSALALASFALAFKQQTHVALYGVGMDDTSFEKSDYGTVPILAKRYVDLVQRVQPNGPYYLAGYSFGGTVAYEMASEFKRNDETVAMVFMVDTPAWFPKALTHCYTYYAKCAEMNLQLTMKLVTERMIEKLAFVQLGITRNDLDDFFEKLGDNEAVITALEDQAAAENLTFPLKEKVSSVQHEVISAAKAHTHWQPSKIFYDQTITYICCDDTKSFVLWSGPEMWKSLAKMDTLYVSGSHYELLEETRGQICGTIMMTTAAMKYQSTSTTLNLQAIRSRPQERLVEFIKQGIFISLLPKPSSSKLVKGTLCLDSDETVFSFKYESFGLRKVHKIMVKELSNILPGRNVDMIQKHHGTKAYIDLLLCMLTNKGKLQTFRCSDWQQLKQLTDALEAFFGIPFLKII